MLDTDHRLFHDIQALVHRVETLVHRIETLVHSVEALVHSVEAHIHSVEAHIHSVEALVHHIQSRFDFVEALADGRDGHLQLTYILADLLQPAVDAHQECFKHTLLPFVRGWLDPPSVDTLRVR